jgi:PIN domain nuclease of toxin-antitoxin system
MRYLIDSNILIFFIIDTDQLTTEVKNIIYDRYSPTTKTLLTG